MKKSTVFKILTLFLTFVIFSCCSGCVIESFIGSCRDKQEAKDKAEFLERARVKKAEADAFIPQVDDYILEAKDFESKEEAIKAGFYPLDDVHYTITTYKISDSEPNIRRISLYNVEKYEYEAHFKYDINNIYGFEFFFKDSQFNTRLFEKQLIEYDGKLFAIPVTKESLLKNKEKNNFIPPSFYLIDFKNEQILYCGYFKGYYDETTSELYGKSTWDYFFKITQNIEKVKN